MKENLVHNIEINEERLANMKKKAENLDREIKLLEQKIENQKFALKNSKE